MSGAPACMGGWCALRDRCPHFHADDRSEPAERLCPPRQDGAIPEFVKPVLVPSLAVEGTAA